MICLEGCLSSELFKVQYFNKRKFINTLYSKNKKLQWASPVHISHRAEVCLRRDAGPWTLQLSWDSVLLCTLKEKKTTNVLRYKTNTT